MCRNILEGGRRCPCDSSEARRLRRHNQKAITIHREKLNQPVVKAEPAPTPAPEPEAPKLTVETVRAAQQELADIHERLSNIDPQQEPEQITVTFRDGTTATFDYTRPDSMWNALERKTTELGEDITALADERAGFSATDIAEHVPQAVKDAEERVATAGRILEGFNKEFDNRYGPSSYRTFQDISSAYGMRTYTDEEVQTVIKNAQGWSTAFSTTHWTQEDVKRDREELAKYLTEKQEATLALRTAKAEAEVLRRELVKQQNEAAMSVLREIREIGGAEIKVQKGSAKKATSALAKVAEVYPKAWVEESNAREEFKAKDSKGRAHYTDGAYQKKYKVGQVSRTVIMDKDEAERDSVYYKFVPVDEETYQREAEADGRFITPVNSDFEGRYTRLSYEASWNAYRAEEYPDPSAIPVPSGRGWELYTEKNALGQPERYRWRKPKVERRLVSAELSAELTVSGGTDEARFSIAAHEFGHRVEGSYLPSGKRLQNLQEAFYKRRTTSADGTRQKLEHMGAGYKRGEVTRPDDFTHRYMGKEYRERNGAVGRYHELLSMGAEAILAGKTGGFLGGGEDKPDYDTRNFMLGLWGSA